MAAAEPTRKPMVEYALEYLSLGYPVFPVCSPEMGLHQHRRNGKLTDCPPDKRGKYPMTSWKDCQTELPSADEVRSWWRRWPNANIGMATGRLPGIVVLDCDSGDARRLALERGGLERTPAVWTGTPGGTHFWMQHPGYEVHNFAKEIPGTDFRGDGGYVLLPPSLHHKGARYRWAENTVGMKLAPVPPWLDALFQRKTSSSSSGQAGGPLDVEEMLRGFDQGERDTGLFKLACRFRQEDQPQAYAEALIQVAAGSCRPAFDLAEAVEKVRYVYRKYEAGGVGPTVDDDEYFGPPTGQAESVPDPLTFVFSRPISELLAMPDEDPVWMVDQLFTVSSNGWIGAEPKVGKSWVGLELVYCLSTGSAFLGRFAVSRCWKVLYIQEEDSSRRVRRRLGQIIRGDAARSVPSDEYLRYVIREGFRIDNPAWIEILRRDVIEFRPDVIVLDVFNRLHGKKENDQQEMTEILRILTSFTNEYGCAFIVVHHDRKPQQGNEARGNQRLRGSGVLGGWGECSLYLRRAKGKDTIIVTPESKDAPEMDDFQFTIEDQANGGVILQVGDVEVETHMSKGDRDVMEAIERLTKHMDGVAVQALATDLDKSRQTIQGRLTRLVRDGYLTATPISSTHNPTIIYAVVSQ